jgi:hypothetical protein
VKQIIKGRLTKTIPVVPLKADLEIMILGNHTEEFVEKVGALTLSQAIDMLNVMTNSK